jgi:cysteine-rich repeat protein
VGALMLRFVVRFLAVWPLGQLAGRAFTWSREMRIEICVLVVGFTAGCGSRTALDTRDGEHGGEPACGNGVVQDEESCDDGNTQLGDGCDACNVEAHSLVTLRIASDYEGGFVLAGRTTTDDRALSRDAWLARYDADGRQQWRHTFEVDPAQTNADIAVAMRRDGAIAVVGTASRGEEGRAWLARFTGEGERVWLRTDSNQASSVAFDEEDDIVVGGLVRDGDASTGGVCKFDPDGEETWRVVLRDPLGQVGAPLVAVDPSGNIYVASTIYPEAAGEAPAALLAQLDPDGAEIWRQVLAGHEPADVDVASEGGALVVGEHGRGPDSDAWAARYTADGRELWRELYDGSAGQSDEGHSVSAAADGGAFAGSRITRATDDGLTSAMSIRRYDASGRAVWTRTFDSETAALLVAHEDGGVFVLGAAESPIGTWLVRRLQP